MSLRSLLSAVSIRRYFGITAAALSLYGAGCTSPSSSKAPDEFVITDGKTDQGSAAKIIRDVDLDSKVTGQFDDHRTYGMTFSAKAGAVLRFAVTATAGKDSVDLPQGAALDTVLAVYGPLKDGQRGRRLLSADDDGTGTGAKLPEFHVAEDGEYLFVLSTWNDPGHGQYTLDLACDGTAFQCRRPVANLPCDPKTRYIVGGQKIGTETWNECKVVLLEKTEVAADSLLTINPGVTVQGNFLDSGSGPYGTVALDVKGTLQAVGTKEAPVVFTAVKDGWVGVILEGPSSTMSNVFVEKAQMGVQVIGAGATLEDIVVSKSYTGLQFEGQSGRASRVRLDQVRDGVAIFGSAVVEDSVISSSSANGVGIGVYPPSTASVFRRAIVSGFQYGVAVTSSELAVEDSTIVNNVRGVSISGATTGVHPQYPACDPIPYASGTPGVSIAPPSSWGRDPSFLRTDILDNKEFAVRVDSPELVVIDQCNVRNNGAGILLATDSLHPASRIVHSNIFGNGGPQVESHHTNGTLDISGNYWAQISDPELSASWRMTHSASRECSFWVGDWNIFNQLSAEGRYGSYVCPSRNVNVTCSYQQTQTWNSPYTFTGFSPTELKAGPELTSCTEDVKQARKEQGL